MTTKFQSSLDKLKAKIAKEGVRVDYIVEEPHLIGQGVTSMTVSRRDFLSMFCLRMKHREEMAAM